MPIDNDKKDLLLNVYQNVKNSKQKLSIEEIENAIQIMQEAKAIIKEDIQKKLQATNSNMKNGTVLHIPNNIF